MKVFSLGISQSFFEASMYTFVFLWTPTLEEGIKTLEMGDLPHGIIFSIFMICCMIGSSLYSIYSKYYSVETILNFVYLISFLSFFIIIFTKNFYVALTSFLFFEGSVGIFWPCIGSLRSKLINEKYRSTIMNYFRIPTNIFVLIVLSHINDLPLSFVYAICSLLLLISLLFHYFYLNGNDISLNIENKI